MADLASEDAPAGAEPVSNPLNVAKGTPLPGNIKWSGELQEPY
jgi:hypothetical protein